MQLLSLLAVAFCASLAVGDNPFKDLIEPDYCPDTYEKTYALSCCDSIFEQQKNTDQCEAISGSDPTPSCYFGAWACCPYSTIGVSLHAPPLLNKNEPCVPPTGTVPYPAFNT